MKRILLVLVLVLGFVPFIMAQDFGGSEGVSVSGAYDEYVVESLKIVYQDASEYIVNIPGGYRLRWASSNSFYTSDQLMIAQDIPNGTITAIYAGIKDRYTYDASGNLIDETHQPAIVYNSFSTSLNITVSDGERARIIFDLAGGSPLFTVTKEAL